MKGRSATVPLLLLISTPPSVFSLFLSLGSGDTYGIICGFYERVIFLPEVETSYKYICENNCQTVIENCVKKMNKICKMVQEKELNDSFCKENHPDIYCRTSLKSDSCVSCKKIPIEKTTMVPRTVKKVRHDINVSLYDNWELFCSENLWYWRVRGSST